MDQLIVWWFLSSLIGWISFPLSFWLFKLLPDRGYTLSRALGLLSVSYAFWIGASLNLSQNTLGGILLAMAGLLAISAWLMLRPGGSLPELRAFVRTNRRLILSAELLFAICFTAWAVLRAYSVGKIMSAGGEKFMEMAFLNGILHSRQFPPLDPWLSGYAISYYYFGYVMMALLTQLSGAVSGVAFDLYDSLLFALSSIGAFGLVYNMAGSRQARRRGAILAGLTGALLTTIMGNLQGLIEALYSRGWLPVGLAEWLAVPGFPAQAQVTGSFNPGSFWGWAWRASRVINDLDLTGHPIALNPITEFPNFSFLLGDNHPHVLALPFVLLAAAVAFHMLLSTQAPQSDHSGSHIRVVVFAWIIGALIFLNTWDYPIYLGLAVAAWLIGKAAVYRGISRWIFWQALRMGAVMATASLLFYSLFLLSFSSQAGGVLPYIFPPTRLVQYLVMFGPFIFILAGFLPISFHLENSAATRPIPWQTLALNWLKLAAGFALLFVALLAVSGLALWFDSIRGGTLAAALMPYIGSQSFLTTAILVLSQRLTNPWLFLCLTALIFFSAGGIYLVIRAVPQQDLEENEYPSNITEPLDTGLLFARLLTLAGILLTFSLEFFYLRDGFGVRMNSVFKFYFQGWVLMACASAYALWWVTARAAAGFSRVVKTAYLSGAALIILGGLVFSVMGILSRTDSFSTPPNLDGESELRRDNPDDWAAIDWLKKQLQPGQPVPILLEAPGTSYTYAGRISAFSGIPALLGWSTHELQWRGSYTEQGQREPIIMEIYTTPNPSTALQLLRDQQVDFVILGATERTYIRAQCAKPEQTCDPVRAEEKFKRILPEVFLQGQTAIYAVPKP